LKAWPSLRVRCSGVVAETNFSFYWLADRIVNMRPSWSLFLGIAVTAGVLIAADVRDLGVPTGWSANQYEKHGYELLNKRDYQNARRYFDAAIRTDPNMWSAYYNRAITYGRQKKWAAALQDLNSTIRLKPSFFTATFARAEVNSQLGNYRASLTDLDRLGVLLLKVRNTLEAMMVLDNRAWLRATCPDASIRNGQLAIADAKKVCELDNWILASRIDTLAAAYAEAGDFDSAVRYEQEAIAKEKSVPEQASKTLAKLRHDPELHKRVSEDLVEGVNKSVAEYSQRLELYKQHRPYRQSPAH
jgi:tetratricopeptide (TPR) repeat protein